MKRLWRRWRTLRRAVRRASLASQRHLVVGYMHNRHRPMHPAELQALTGLGRRLLRATLRSLDTDGLIRTVHDYDVLLGYELTEEGRASW